MTNDIERYESESNYVLHHNIVLEFPILYFGNNSSNRYQVSINFNYNIQFMVIEDKKEVTLLQCPKIYTLYCTDSTLFSVIFVKICIQKFQ